MATVFKTLTNNDVASTRTLLHEAIPITGSIPSGTYANDANIRNYAHGMFQTVYDYPFLSSSANHIFDITAGYSVESSLSRSANAVQQDKKINIYNQMAQILAGYDATGSILRFDEDGDVSGGGTKLRECIFINFARLLTKDEIKKGSFTLKLSTGSTEVTNKEYDQPVSVVWNDLATISDYQGTTNYRTNSPAGEYGILYHSAGGGGANKPCGLLYYQAGVAVLTASIFSGTFGAPAAGYQTSSIQSVLSGAAISASCDGFRNRLYSVQFNNTTELNSTIYFCRANHNDFNYSSNPTFLSSSRIRVKDSTVDSPVSYITTIGMYSADNELLAVAKLSEPIKKTPETELTLRVRLDY